MDILEENNDNKNNNVKHSVIISKYFAVLILTKTHNYFIGEQLGNGRPLL